MNQVKIEVQIDVNDVRQVQALNSFLTAIGLGETPKQETPKKPAPKAEESKKSEAPKVEETKKDPVEESTQSNEPEIKIEEVRALLAKKVQDNRTEIKSKLTALGANNVTSLAKEKYPEFVEFLNGLK